MARQQTVVCPPAKPQRLSRHSIPPTKKPQIQIQTLRSFSMSATFSSNSTRRARSGVTIRTLHQLLLEYVDSNARIFSRIVSDLDGFTQHLRDLNAAMDLPGPALLESLKSVEAELDAFPMSLESVPVLLHHHADAIRKVRDLDCECEDGVRNTNAWRVAIKVVAGVVSVVAVLGLLVFSFVLPHAVPVVGVVGPLSALVEDWLLSLQDRRNKDLREMKRIIEKMAETITAQAGSRLEKVFDVVDVKRLKKDLEVVLLHAQSSAGLDDISIVLATSAARKTVAEIIGCVSEVKGSMEKMRTELKDHVEAILADLQQMELEKPSKCLFPWILCGSCSCAD